MDYCRRVGLGYIHDGGAAGIETKMSERSLNVQASESSKVDRVVRVKTVGGLFSGSTDRRQHIEMS